METYLNLDEVTLWIWENEKKESKVQRYINDLLLGDVFPPVHVYTDDFENYELIGKAFRDSENSYNLGGHYRAYACWKTKKTLRVIVHTDIHPAYRDAKKRVHTVKDIMLV